MAALGDGDLVSRVCGQVEDMRRAAVPKGLAAQVEALVGRIVGGDELELSELVRLFRALDGPEVLDRVVPVPGLGGGEPARVVYRCPRDRCTRVGERPPGGAPPYCHVYGAAMRIQALR